ncbi:glycosyltransferase family 2 protein [Kitasatospora sp. NPDC048194]|uniref:glycosyltransferase family 2 protein n=1 Tax=Kitasatospora sp. NPDC048194 TaxID=3364045 RepID=UPI003710AE10
MTAPYAVVVPTIGRPELNACLAALAACRGPAPRHVVVVDDRPLSDCTPLDLTVPAALRDRLTVLPGCGNGPAAARNTGWRAVREPWVVFLDDDTVPGRSWAAELAADLDSAAPGVAAVQGRIVVPLPGGRRPTDWERTTAGLADARWITADLACRRAALVAVGGFDERFRRAFREDADLALRLIGAGWELTRGHRSTAHPVRAADPWVSLRAQAGNADDALMVRLHGRDWWERAGAGRGRLRRHAAVTAAGLAAVVLPLFGARRAAGAAACAWLVGTAEFALARILPGPRTAAEIRAMLRTSALIPPAAVRHRLLGTLRHRNAPPWSAATAPVRPAGAPAAELQG